MEIKNCPCCNSEMVGTIQVGPIESSNVPAKYYITCLACGCTTILWLSVEEAIRDWNEGRVFKEHD